MTEQKDDRADFEKRAMMISTCSAIVNQVFPLFIFFLALDPTPFQVGIYQAVVALSIFCRPLAVLLIGRYPKVRIVSVVHTLVALLLLCIATVPSIPLPREARLYLVMVLFLFRAALMQTFSTAWWPLIREKVKEKHAGRFFSRLRSCVAFMSVLIMFGSGWWIGGKTGAARFVPLVLIAAFFAFMRALIVRGVSERWEPQPIGLPAIMQRFGMALRNAEFRTALLMTTIFVGCRTAIIGPMYSAYLKALGYHLGTMIKFGAVMQFGALISLWLWARVVDRHGTRPLLSSTILVLSCLTVARGFIPAAGPEGGTPAGLGMIYAITFLDGIFFFSCLRLLLTKVHFRVVKREWQTEAFILLICAPSLVATVFSPLAGLAVKQLGRFQFTIPGTVLPNYALVIMSGAVLFASGWFLRKGLPSYHQEKSVVHFIRDRLPEWGYDRTFPENP